MALSFIFTNTMNIVSKYKARKAFSSPSALYLRKSENHLASNIYNTAINKLEKKRFKAQYAMESLGESKLAVYRESIIPFVDSFIKMYVVNFDKPNPIGINSFPQINEEEFNDMNNVSLMIKSFIEEDSAVLGLGGLTAFAAYGSSQLKNNAHISNENNLLSATVAMNATVVWLGGSLLAAGGVNITSETSVLGGIFSGPVLAVGGMHIDSQTDTKDEEYTELEKARIVEDMIWQAEVKIEEISRRCRELDDALIRLHTVFKLSIDYSIKLIEHNPCFETYTNADKKHIYLTLSMAKLLQNIIDVPLLDNAGNLTAKSQDVVDEVESIICKLH